MHQDATNFRLLNVAGQWPGFKWRGLRLSDDNSLRLLSVPLRMDASISQAESLPPDGPAGVASACGDLFYTVPDRGGLARVERCFGERQQIPSTTGFQPGLASPRGIAASRDGSRLFVCDSGNGRLAVLRLDSLEWSATWDASGVLRTPVAVAADDDGFIYVADAGTCTVQRLNARGTLVPEFWSRVASAHVIDEPAGVAVWQQHVFVLDTKKRAAFVFKTNGSPVFDDYDKPLAVGRGVLQNPLGLAADGQSVYIGDNATRRVLVFAAHGRFPLTGAAVGYDGPIAALAADACGHLFVHDGRDVTPVSLTVDAAFVKRGLLFGGPFDTNEPKTIWHRLRTIGDTPAGTDVQVFVHTTNSATAPPYEPDSAQPFPAPAWRTAPTPVPDLFIDSQSNAYLWVGAIVSSDGGATPRLSDMRAEFNHETLLPLLPVLYRQEASRNDQLTRLLSLFETFYDDVDDLAVTELAWLDPVGTASGVLPWLSSWLDVDGDAHQSEIERRRTIANAYEQFARVGTPGALRDALWREAGVRAVIHEPLQAGCVWVLGGCTGSSANAGALGSSTGLAAAAPDGAILGRTATLGTSHLIRNEELGSPLFEGGAHRFTVHITERAFRTDRRVRAERVIERDKPAHTAYRLCEIAPTLVVGVQSVLGVTTIIGSRPLAGRLNDGAMVLGGDRAAALGDHMELGRSTRL